MSKRLKTGLLIGSLILIVGIGLFLYSVFSHSPNSHLKVIPKNAAAVLKINIKELTVKADLQKLMQEPAFKNNATSNFSFTKLVSDPFSTGIDPRENIYGFLSKEDVNTVTAIVFKISDKNDLSAFVSGLGISQAIEVESGINYSEIDAKRCIAWNDDAGILIAVSGGDVKNIAAQFLNQDKDESILSNNSYKTFSEKLFDIGLFLDNKILSQMSGAENSLTALGFTDGHGELMLNFENEKISTLYTNYPETPNPNTFLKQNGFEQNHHAAIAPQTPLVYFGIAADVNALFSSIRRDPEMKDNLIFFESYLDLSDEETRNIFNGDVSIAFTDFRDIATYDPRIKVQIEKMIKEYGEARRSDFALAVPMAYFSIGITNELKVDSILAKSGLQKIENFYAVPGINVIIYACAKNGNLFITNDYYAAESFSNAGTFETQYITEISKTKPLLLWADLDQKHFPLELIMAMKENYNPQTIDVFLSALKPFKNLNVENKENGYQLDINLNSGSGNSLYQLLSYFGSLAN
ncbi:MAG: DUF4836 family protein [Bacteroidetes bacterium]|nr:DUF4836 family protein [Bacteroidota bacterium]